ncbi:hypothetical protein FXO37_28261 [Capsicum annuum]|nr:hypothetical protein FXO37_28261 [Capsicum annuum]
MEVDKPDKPSFKEILQDKRKHLNCSYDDLETPNSPSDIETDDEPIQISEEERARIYQPWRFSVIIKLTRNKISHQYLKAKLTKIWKPIENLTLIDLRYNFHIVKFDKQENMNRALHDDPWFILEGFRSVKKWEPNFAPKEFTLTHTATRVQLLQLHTGYYNKGISEKVGRKIGAFLKIDTCTSSTLRGRYARICIKILMNEPVKSSITIGRHVQEEVDATRTEALS